MEGRGVPHLREEHLAELLAQALELVRPLPKEALQCGRGPLRLGQPDGRVGGS